MTYFIVKLRSIHSSFVGEWANYYVSAVLASIECETVTSCVGYSNAAVLSGWRWIAPAIFIAAATHAHTHEARTHREQHYCCRRCRRNSSHIHRYPSVMALRRLMSHVLCATSLSTTYYKKCQPGVWTHFYNRKAFSTASAMAAKYETVEIGTPNSTTYRVFISKYSTIPGIHVRSIRRRACSLDRIRCHRTRRILVLRDYIMCEWEWLCREYSTRIIRW